MRRFVILLFAVMFMLVGCGGGSDGVPSGASGTAGERLASHVEDYRTQAGIDFMYDSWDVASGDDSLRRALDVCAYQPGCAGLLGDAVIQLCDAVLPDASEDEQRTAAQMVLDEHFAELDRSARADALEILQTMAYDISLESRPWCT